MPQIHKFEEEREAQENNAKEFKADIDEKAALKHFEERSEQLKEHRRGLKVEDIWKAADKAYVPHVISEGSKKKVLVADEDVGWRSQLKVIGKEDDWQEDSVPSNPYIKIQTALGVIVDQNPTAILNPASSKFQKNSDLMSNLYHRSWEVAHSKSAALKPFVFNTAKYGLGVGRTFPLTIRRFSREITNFNPGDKSKNTYEEREHIYYNDIYRQSMSPWQVWIDDGARVGDPFSNSDVMYYIDYSWDRFKSQFGHLENFKNYIKPKKQIITEDREISTPIDDEQRKISRYMERVWFYENLELDLLFVMTNDKIPLIVEPLPQKIESKALSVWTAPWTLRNDTSPYGIGVYEAMRNDHKIHTKIRNMTIDQLVLSIYKEWFYSGSDKLSVDGTMKMRPGAGRQVNDPKSIVWNDIPGPGREAWEGIDRAQKAIDDSSGITPPIIGEITGKTAFEVQQAREAALRRLKTPLDNINDALERDAAISLALIEDMYSVPKIKLLAENRFLEPFELETMKESEDFDASSVEEEYREIPMKLDRDESTGEITQTDDESFFKLKPDDLHWEGIIKIKGQSIIANSELLERVTVQELSNMLLQLLQFPPELALKPAKEIIKSYDKDPKDWLPDVWLNPPQEQQIPPEQNMETDNQGEPMFVDAGGIQPEPQSVQAEANLQQTTT